MQGMEDQEEVCNTVLKFAQLLSENNFQGVITFLEDPKNTKITKNGTWNFIRVVCMDLKNSDKNEKSSEIPNYEEILLVIASNGNPNQALLGLLEEAKCFQAEMCFCLLMKPLQKVLLRVPGKRGRSLVEVINVLYAHILSIPLPMEQILLMDFDIRGRRICLVLESCLEFFSPFVEEVSTIQKKEVFYLDRVARQQEILGTYLFRLLDNPLLHYDLHHEVDAEKTPIRMCSEKIVLYLTKMFSNVFLLYDLVPETDRVISFPDNLFEDHTSSETEEDSFLKMDVRGPPNDSVTNCAVATFAYLMYFEGLAVDFRPYIYSHNYILDKHLPYIITLISKSEKLIIYKGLNLAKTLVNNVSDFSLPEVYVEKDIYVTFLKILLNVASKCSIEDHQKLAFSILKSYFDKFNWSTRCMFLMTIISSKNFSQVHFLMIEMYENCLEFCFKNTFTLPIFSGKNLRNFLRHALKLTDKIKANILENRNYYRIMNAVSLLALLVIEDDRRKNATGIWKYINSIKNKFLKPIGRAVRVSDTFKREKGVYIPSVSDVDLFEEDFDEEQHADLVEKGDHLLEMVSEVIKLIK